MTVGDMEGRMSYREFVSWVAFYGIEREHEQEAALDAQLIARHKRRG